MRYISALCLLAALAACDGRTSTGPQDQPLITVVTGSHVAVQAQPQGDPYRAQARSQATAQRVCGQRGQSAQHSSTRALSDQISETVYLCR